VFVSRAADRSRDKVQCLASNHAMEVNPLQHKSDHEANTAAERLEREQASTTEAPGEVLIGDDWAMLPPDPAYTNPTVQHHCKRINGYDFIIPNFWLAQGYDKHLTSFQARPSDIIVVSFPKSGTSWLQEIVWRVVHRETGVSSGNATLEYRFPTLEFPSAKFMKQRPLEDVPDPRLIKTHLPYQVLAERVGSSGAKVLYVSRDARDVCVSLYYFNRMALPMMYRGTFREFRDRFTSDSLFPGPYREHVKSYLDHADTVLCLTYEQLHSNRAEVVRKIATFLGRTLTDADVEGIVANTSFAAMKANPNANFHWRQENGFAAPGAKEGTYLRKGKVGDWTNHFTEAESDFFMKWRNEPV